MLIPLYAIDRQLERYIDEDTLAQMTAVQVVRNRRGHPTRAYRTGQLPQRALQLGNAGDSFEQHLANGKVWAFVMPRARRAVA